MISCRLLLRNTLITTDKFSASYKCTISGKSPNVIKTFNTENKNLFGNLLETKAKRRKNESKASVVTKSSATTNLEALVHNEAQKKKSRTKKIKDIESSTVVLSDNSLSRSSLTNNSCEDVLKNDVSNNTFSEVNSQKSNISHTGIDSTRNLASINKQELQTDESSTILSDKFILQSAIPMNENSYPLDNLNKLEFSTKSGTGTLENVLNYGFTDPLVKDYMRYPSVSKIMESTMSPTSRMVLSKWRKNMIADLGEEGFAKHCTALKERGHEFHEAVRNAVLSRSSEGCHSDVTRNALQSLEWVLALVTNPLAVESIIAHPRLQYKGIPDCVAMFRGVPVVIDWKLSEKPKKDLKDTYDAPVQITAYMGALNHDPNYKWKVSHGLVAVAYTSGDPCDVFLLAPKHCEIYWRHWLLRFHKFNARSHLHTDHKIDEKALESV